MDHPGKHDSSATAREPAAGRIFCTYFDSRYAARGFAMIDSLRRASPGVRVFVLCLDDECLAICRRLAAPGVNPIAMAELEKADPELAAVKSTRSLIEYYFTCTASFLHYLFQRRPEITLLTYVDADLFFFADVEPLFTELGDAAIGIIEHRFSPPLTNRLGCGRFNVGWLSFRRGDDAMACLRWWRERCIDWCYDRVEGTRFADQRYLDEWPSRFAGVRILEHPGANVAPWNVARHPIRGGARLVLSGDTPLIFYHFHGLRRLRPWLYDTQLRHFAVHPTRALRRLVYLPYLRAVAALEASLPTARYQPSVPLRRILGVATESGIVMTWLRLVKAFLSGQLIVVPSPPSSAAKRECHL